MQNNAPAPPPANVNTNVQMPPQQQQQYNSELERQYNLLAQKIAENCGIKIQGKIDVDILAKSTADFFEKKDAMQGSSQAFQELGKSWRQYIYDETNPNPLRLAMGGSLFAASGDDIIEVNTKGLNENVKKNFYSVLNSINAKVELEGQQPNETIKVKREDLMKAAIIYRLRNPVCTPEDEKLYNRILAGTQNKDLSIQNKNNTFSSITSVLTIGSTIGSTLMAFGVVASTGPVAIAVMAITALMLIPRIVSLCRSLTKLGYEKEAGQIKKSFELFNGAIQKDGNISANISRIMMEHYSDKEKQSVDLGQMYLDKVKATPQQREKITGIVSPAKLNSQQQKAMNNAYGNNYQQKPILNNIDERSIKSLTTANSSKCRCM